MTIVRTSYRPKRAPRRKPKQPALAQAIVSPAPMKKRLKGPVIRLGDEDRSDDTTHPPRPAIAFSRVTDEMIWTLGPAGRRAQHFV
jgi:hypothetical protein